MIYTHTQNLFDKSQTKKKHSQKRDKKILPFPKRGKKYDFFRREGKKQKRALSLKIARPHARVEETNRKKKKNLNAHEIGRAFTSGENKSFFCRYSEKNKNETKKKILDC